MRLRLRWPMLLCAVLFACAWLNAARGEEPSTSLPPAPAAVPDPAVEQAITDALNTDKAIAYPAIKKLSEFGPAARRALDTRLFNEKTQRGRVQLAEIIARACEGRVAFRITLELTPEGGGKLRLESDRTMLAECARKFDRINNNPPTTYDEDEMRRNPYGRGELAKHMEGSMKYVLGESTSRDGRIVASGEVAFATFDEFAAFATSFDRSGYHLINGITLTDNNNLRTLHFKKNPDQNQSAARYLLLFHDVKWEFVLDFKGQIQNSNATSMARNKHIWTFNCAQMLTGEAEIEASFDARQTLAGAPSAAGTPAAPEAQSPVARNNDPVAIVTSKVVSVMMGRRDDNGVPVTRGPDYEVLLDGRQSAPQGPDLHYQWVQTSGVPLNLAKERIAIPVIKMLIYQPGEYRFELTVAKDDKISAPAEVLVLVGDGIKPEIPGTVAAAIQQANTQNSTQNQFEMPYVKKVAEAPRRASAQPPAPNNSESSSSAVFDVGGNRIELALIQQVENEYHRNRDAGGSSLNIVVPNSLVVEHAASPQDTVRLPIPRAGEMSSAPPIPVIPPAPLNGQPNDVVASNDNSLTEIRRAEAEFNRGKNAPQSIPTAVAPLPAPPVAPPLAPPVESSVKPFVPPAVSSPSPVIPPVPVEPEVPLKDVKRPEPLVKIEPRPEVKPELGNKNAKQDLKDFENALKGTDTSKKAPVAPAAPAASEVVKAPVPPVPPMPPAPPAVVKEAIRTAPAAPVAGVGDTREQGLAEMKAGQYAAAVETFKRANKARPDEDTQVQQGIAMLYAAEKPDGYDRSGTLDAVTLFEEILAKNPKNLTAIMYYGHGQARMENMQQAVQIYREGVRLGGDAVRWESMWQFGNKSNKGKDYEMALTMLKDAAETALKAKVTDVRLERDFAVAFHGAKKDDEALKHANNVLALGYVLDPQLAAELKLANTPSAPVASANVKLAPPVPPAPPSVAPVKPVEPQVAESKPVPAAVAPAPAAAVEPKAAVSVAPPQVVDNRSEMEKRFANLANNKDQIAAEQKKTEDVASAAVAAAAISPKISAPIAPAPIPPVPVEPESKRVAVNPPAPAVTVTPEVKKAGDPAKPAPTQTVAELEEQARKLMGTPTVDSKTGAPLPADIKRARVKKKLPAVPAQYDDAMAAARSALARGLKLSAQKDEALKPQVQDAWDEAEAMLRGAWDTKPANKEAEVLEQFGELSKQVGAIALVSSQNLISKKNGLVILNAEPSVIFPKDKQLFYAWEQVEGPELDLRRENLTSKKLGLRIKDPGVYKFELVVSDGVRGGNPVTVTVEVQDRGL